MKITSKINTSITSILFIIGVFLCVISPNFLSEGMFQDGIYYAAVSKNLSHGLGTFWKPYFNEMVPEFLGCPPLMFGIQSIFFNIFGDSFYVEKCFSVLTFFISGLIIMLLWKEITGSKRNNALPLLFWICFPLVTWASTNNLLENLMTIFILLSILFYFKSINKNKNWFLIVMGIMISLGFLTKGFPALFPLALPLFYQIIFKRKHLIMNYLIIILSTILPLILLMMVVPQFTESFKTYLNIQVIDGILNQSTVATRWYILYKFLQEIIIPVLILVVLIAFVLKFKNIKTLLPDTYSKKIVLVLILLGLSGVFPLMISMKQRGFYLLPVFPIFSILFAMISAPMINILKDKIENKYSILVKSINILVLTIGVVLCLLQINKIGRDKDILTDIYKILPELETHSIVSIDSSMHYEWTLFAYFARYKNITLDTKWKKYEYLLIFNDKKLIDKYTDEYELLSLDTNTLLLFRQKE
ncbi:glycosyltransferase family 39 protein [Odoribacter sp. OttesenSCG-928-L07]|nr:glycosyltransferase family 39 protein [Odoribacter sp. OttesenSCG-928-L07]MDL2239082.1 glycosyltransferase family 39 protein [Bacteroidales bacterium OttesenSCG-928-L14]MDL2239995.1 glycosyltransferase family 39 protein [Bacteroidales bacterium OttesenSCG-928-K22]